MGRDGKHSIPRWRRTRYGFVFFCLVSLLVGWTALRVVLVLKFAEADRADWQAVLLEGVKRDFLVGLAMLLPLLVWFLIIPENWLVRTWHRYLFRFGCFVWGALQILLLVVEYFFFVEHGSRLDAVAVDGARHLDELVLGRQDWLPLLPWGLGIVCLSFIWVWLGHRWFASMWELPASVGRRIFWLLAVAALGVAYSPLVNFDGVKATGDDTLNEIANNGEISFVTAAWRRQAKPDSTESTTTNSPAPAAPESPAH